MAIYNSYLIFAISNSYLEVLVDRRVTTSIYTALYRFAKNSEVLQKYNNTDHIQSYPAFSLLH